MPSGLNTNIRNLAEAIILQSIEDLWDTTHREDCLAFFSGGRFRICADIAGMNTYEQKKMLYVVNASAGQAMHHNNGA